MPIKKTSCERVLQKTAGPTSADIVDSIRAEYGLPRPRRRETRMPDAKDASPASKPKQVKP